MARLNEDIVEEECRICRMPSDDNNPLYFPCNCSGSIRYVHESCLQAWLSHRYHHSSPEAEGRGLSHSVYICEVCKHPFKFSAVYADNTPTHLSSFELIIGLSHRSFKAGKVAFRAMLVFLLWIVIVPLISTWIWRLSLSKSVIQWFELIWTRMGAPAYIATDCICGSILTAAIILALFAGSSLRAYIRFLRETRAIENPNHNPVIRPNRDGVIAPNDMNRPADILNPADDWIQDQVMGGGGPIENQGDLAHRQEFQDGVEAPDPDDIPIAEMIGLHGNIVIVIESALTILCTNAAFLFCAAFIPFSIGRSVLAGIDAFLRHGPKEYRPPQSAVTWLLKALTKSSTSNGQIIVPTSIHEENFSEVTLLGLGYFAVLFIASTYFLFFAACKHVRTLLSSRMRSRLQNGLDTDVTENTADSRPNDDGLWGPSGPTILLMIKVATMLCLELGAFPIICGLTIDISTLSLFDSTIGSRSAFWFQSPLLSAFVHWIFGTAFALQVALSIKLLRTVIRPAVLSFLRDPSDPNFNPIREFVEEPFVKLIRRMILSCILYAVLIFMFIFVPVQLARLVAPLMLGAKKMFPLHIHFTLANLNDLPTDILLLHISFNPWAIEYKKTEELLRVALRVWITKVGGLLGIAEYLLANRSDLRNEQNVDNFIGQNDATNEDEITFNASTISVDSAGRPKGFKMWLRIYFLLVLAWVTLVCVHTSIVLVPICLGRMIIAGFISAPAAEIYNKSDSLTNRDFYAFTIGCYFVCALRWVFRQVATSMNLRQIGQALQRAMELCFRGLAFISLAVLWIVVIPLTLGTLLELAVIVPFRISLQETPILFYYTDWALGIVVLKTWIKFCSLGISFVGSDRWIQRFQTLGHQLRQQGLENLDPFDAIANLAIPIMRHILLCLAIPYVISNGILPLLGLSYYLCAVVHRFSYGVMVVSWLLWAMGAKIKRGWKSLRAAIRDDRYLVGRRLHNVDGSR